MKKKSSSIRFGRIIAVVLSILGILYMSACSSAKKSIKLLTPEDMLFCGDQLLISASVYKGEKNVTHKSQISWHSSNNDVATVDEKGTVFPVAPGSVTISASLTDDSTIKASTEIVVGCHVTSISLPDSKLSLLAGTSKDTAALTAMLNPENAFYQEIHWESSDEKIATVSPDGIVKAVSPGTVFITAASTDPSCEAKDTCNVTVTQGVTEIILSKKSLDYYWGENHTLTAEVLPQNAENTAVVWSSTDESIATVSENGEITAVAPGQVEIRCTALDGSDVFGSCAVNVVIPIEKISLEDNKVLLLIEASEELSKKELAYTVLPENATYQNVTWVSSDESIAIVDENGIITGVAPGTATITAYSTDPRAAETISAACEVTVGNAVQSISVTGITGKISKNSYIPLKATVSPENVYNPNVEWKSDNESIIKVDSRGGISAVGTGRANVICTAKDGSNTSVKVPIEVYQPVASLRAVENGNNVIFGGKTMTLNVTVYPEDATDKRIEWTSEDTSIATVDSSGKVTAKKQGQTYITATAKDGSKRSCRFFVTVEPEVPLTLESLGFGIYNANLLGITVKNQCTTRSIKNFDFDIKLIAYTGAELDSSGSYSIGEDVYIGPCAEATIKRTLSGVSWAQKIKITITGVTFADGTYYSIPWLEQQTWSFSR